MKTSLNTLILVSKVPRGRFLINKYESNLDALINMKQVPRGRFLINKYESTLDALINSNQVPRGCFLINKCGNNSKYIDKEYTGPKRLFSYQQV